jgi:phosphoribosylanthranilate isomerase
MWVKVCGNTNLHDALLAGEAGADAVGFVFAESSRRVTPAQVGEITARLPKFVEKIGVFVDGGFEAIVDAVESAGLTGVQLHSAGDPELAARLRERLGRALRILQVVHYQQGLETQLAAAKANAAVDGVLVDSRTAVLLGGTGQRYDWAVAKTRFAQCGEGLRLVVAGGLNPENVGEAVAVLRPWGVDVVSGVESSPGVKDAAKVRAFVENARVAVGHGKVLRV